MSLHEKINSVEKKAKIIIDHGIQKNISDFPVVKDYLNKKFSSVDISNIKIYISPAEFFDEASFGFASGIYFPTLLTVVINDRSNVKPEHCKSVFKNKLTQMQSKVSTKIDDVLVHEMIHAISHKSNRSSQIYTNMEEIFVYTNCIEYYLERGVSEKEIIERDILPFCVADVLGNKDIFNKMLQDLYKVGVPSVDFWEMEEEDKELFLDQYVDFFISQIKRLAMEKGFFMIETYKKYGQTLSILPNGPLDNRKLRFSCIKKSDL